jgi:hypothetical protein
MRHPPPYLVAALLAMIGAPLHAASPTYGCNDYAPATINVKPVFDDVEYDSTQPMLKIRDLAASGTTGTQSESWPVGLASGQFYLSVTKDIFKTRSSYDPTTCGQIKAIHVEMGFAKNTIYIAKEFPRRSCPYKIVMGHEEKHKAVDRQLLKEYSEKAKSFFARAAETIGVIRNGSGAALDNEMGENISRAMDQFSQEIEDERKSRQKEVDSSEEYARVSAACSGNLMAIVNERLAILEETSPGITKPEKDKKKSEAPNGFMSPGGDTPAAGGRSGNTPATLARPSNPSIY